MLAVSGLEISFPAATGRRSVVRNVSFEVRPGECVGLVGESGSGKTVSAHAALGLVSPPGSVDRGRIELDGQVWRRDDPNAWAQLRGRRISLVFQEPTAALNPALTIGFQLIETLRRHRKLDRAAARREAVRLLESVAMPAAESRLSYYPHQLSGGQCQRVMLALALAGEPRFLIADEPTTALDVTVQAQILDLLSELRRELGLGVLLITHDLAVVAESCQRVVVLHAGEVVEQGEVSQVFHQPSHPYTRQLLASQLSFPLENVS